MPQRLHVLIIEDNPYDAELLVYELRQAGFAPAFEVVKTEKAFLAHLNPNVDVILADYSLPQFDAMRALTLLKEHQMDIPFIIVSGAISDEVAVETIKQGTSDYLLKDRLARLGPAIRRALKERDLQRERRLAHQALKRSEALNRAVLHSLAAHVAVLTAEGKVIMVNEAWPAFARDNEGRHFLADGVGTDFRAACDHAVARGDDHAGRARLGIEAVLDGIQPLFSMEYAWDGDGMTQWYLMQVTPLEDEQGGVVVLHENITQLKRTEEALRFSEERWRSLVASHPETILISTDGVITYINKAGARIFGAISAEQLIGESMYRFIHGEQHDTLRLRQEALMRGDPTAPIVYKLVRLDGEERDVEAFSVPIIYNGQSAAQTVFRDVTERRRFEEDLIAAKEQAEEVANLKSTILTNMSHEIRTPLTTILGFAEVLADEVKGEHQMLVKLIQQGGRRLSTTLNSVLDLARLESGSLVLNPERIDVAAEVTELVTLFIPLAHERGLELAVTPPSEPTWADVDIAVMGRIVNNLVGNALKFTEAGSITVTVRADLDEVRLIVEDTGIGIDTHFLPHLFDAFKQESTGIARSHEGTGLGLTITKRLVHLMGGEIEVDSTPGQGSRFTVTLPRFVTSPKLPRLLTPFEPIAAPETGKPLHLLVVEDNADTQTLIGCMLDDQCQADYAADGETALQRAEDEHYDIILMDINLASELNGTAVMTALRARPSYHQTPIVAVTAYALPGDRERFLNIGFDDYLSKPFTRKQLLNVLASMAERL